MKNKKCLRIVLGIVTTVLLIAFLAILSVKPWVRKKIEAALNEKFSDYTVTIDKVSTSMIPSGIELEGINIRTKTDYGGVIDIKGEIGSIKLKGINLIKAIFKKDLNIRKIIISESTLIGKISCPRDTVIPVVLPLNMRIGIVIFNRINLLVENSANAASYSFTDGVLRLYDVHAGKKDTLSPDIIKLFDFKAKEIVSVSSDSMHTFKASGINYSEALHALDVNSLYILPNYTDYDFTSRYDFQTNRIEAGFSGIHVNDFNIAAFLRSGNLISSSIDIGEMDMKVFRDKRKEFRHVNRPAFQNMIYNYPGAIRIDLISLKKGNVSYTVHAAKANEPGSISFNEINAEIYNITNDSVCKTKNDSLLLKGNALLMGKGRMTILLKARLFDSQNRFSLDGTLSDMEANELNPILEKNAFIYATSGKIDSMNFSFTADNTKASGRLTVLYHGLDIAVKNKQTDDTTAFRERFISFIVNRKVLDSNPIRDKDVREGIIDFERDPEKFLFHYCYRSILSGITSSLVKNTGKINK
jgi:hypothetical protein